jgi:hypothetical protein
MNNLSMVRNPHTLGMSMVIRLSSKFIQGVECSSTIKDLANMTVGKVTSLSRLELMRRIVLSKIQSLCLCLSLQSSSVIKKISLGNKLLNVLSPNAVIKVIRKEIS